MPVVTTTSIHITCDNAACPGNSLDPADRTGWFFVNREVYGQLPEQLVYCCAECSGTIGSLPPPGPPVDAGEPIPG